MAQTLPQPPQFLSSVCVFTHWGDVPAPQLAIPAPALQAQTPPAQFPSPQSWPQLPQLFGSVAVSTHWGEADGPHEVYVPQSHEAGVVAAEQVPRVPQACPHLPQFGSMDRLTQGRP